MTTIPTLSNDKVTRMLMPAYRPTLHSQTVYMPEYRAKRYAAVSVMPTFDFSDRFFLRTGIYAMFAERFRPTDDRMRYIVDASLVYHTGIGPISLADEVQRQELGQPLPDLQFRLCDVPSARNPLLTTLWFNDSTTI